MLLTVLVLHISIWFSVLTIIPKPHLDNAIAALRGTEKGTIDNGSKI